MKKTKIDIFSGFLGAGKTTLIKKLIKEAYAGEKIVLIENEFGEIGIDGGFMKDAGIEVTEMNSGCICCSLVGDFGKALHKVIEEYTPDRILIEPSGVGKLSDVIRAANNAVSAGAVLNSFTTVADVSKCKMYIKNFGEFFNDQIENAGCIILSRTQNASDAKIEECVALLREHNATAVIVTTPWDSLDGTQILEAMERTDSMENVLEDLMKDSEVCPECGHHHDEDEECECHHHHDDDDDEECECHHHHHDDDDEECECHHHHHDDDDEECECHHHHDDDDDGDHEHHHHHHHHHHADDVFESWGVETTRKFEENEIKEALEELENAEKYGVILRAKGIVAPTDGEWIHFDFVPGESNVRHGSSAVIGRLCVIGSKINKKAISELFGIAYRE